ncbi:M20 family metallopeptidase [Amphibacillus sediminis]|uniref:M20 family metallopeptidase n=1 Tax=Amphibacillus sediminis TaxID=360185 RepID=UPI00083608A7|nr:M20 family metallopeptidase [Amphibacillus sediminis]
MWQDILEQVNHQFNEMVEMRRYLHQHPELSFQEFETVKFIKNFYQKLALPYQAPVGENGVVARLEGGKPGKTIAIRADFDALPIQDQKDVPYRSKKDGVMHACGHDGHTTILLTLAKLLKQYQNQLAGNFVFIHQHAEELTPGGAKSIIEAGALDDVDVIFGTHLWTGAPLGTVQTAPSRFMAGADKFKITIYGQGGHGAMPHQTKDAVVIGSQLVNNLQQIVSRRLNPLDTAVLTIGKFQAGDAFNIIADQAILDGTVRTFDPIMQDQMIKEMEAIIAGTCQSYQVDFDFDYIKGYPPVINHQQEAELVLKAAQQVPEVQTATFVKPTMTAEDFSYYLLERPGAFFFTGAQQTGQNYPHHHPKFDFDEQAMRIAVKTFLKLIEAYQ